MSNDTRPVPTNLDGWPGVTDLVVSYKHLLHVLWSSPSSLVSIVGVGRPGVIEHLTGAARQDEPVIMEALRELHRRSLVFLDEGTREVAVRRWCKYHKFSGRWAAQAKIAFNKIESAAIKSVLVRHEGVNAIFPVNSKGAPPNSNDNSNNNVEAASTPEHAAKPSAAAPQHNLKRRHPDRTPHGIECWYPNEDAVANAIEEAHAPDLITAAVAAIKVRTNSAGRKTSPVPALVLEELERMGRAADAQRKAQQIAETTDELELDPVAQTSGKQMIESVRRKLLIPAHH